MKNSAVKIFDLSFKVLLIAVIASTLFLFTNLTTDFYDSSKFVILIFFVMTGLILLTVKFMLLEKVTIVRTPLDIPFILFATVAVVSTFMSESRYVALLGNQSRIGVSLVAIIVLVLFYFLVVNILRSVKEIKLINLSLIGFSSILSILTLLAYAGVKLLPSPWVHGINFTTTGSNFSTTAILALLLPFLITELLRDQKGIPGFKPFGISIDLKIVYSLILTITGITIVLTGVLATYLASLAAIGITLLVNNKALSHKNLLFLAVPFAIAIFFAIFSYLPIPNKLHSISQQFPKEGQQLDFVTSWKVAVSAFRDKPFWGTGPSTFLFDFTNYKPIEFNNLPYWNLRFDSAFNEYLLALATLGGIGLLSLLSLTAMFINSSYKTLMISYKLSLEARKEHSFIAATAVSGLVFFIILSLHSATLPLWIIGIIILASFASLNLLSNYGPHHAYPQANSVKDILVWIAGNTEETLKIDALPSVLFVVVVSASLATLYFGGKVTLADYHHRLALNAVAQNDGLLAYNQLVIAEKLNPVSDMYRTDIAQTNFALANAIATAKAPTESSPSGSLTDQDKQNIQVLLQQSIDEGKTAVALNPKSAINWEILALLYRQISGVAQNALVFSLDAYGKAIQQDPLNPLLRVNVGGVYYATQNYDLAIRFFTDSINLKPDYANAYYNLSVALRDKGDLATAKAAGDQLLKILDPKSDDYKVASSYLEDLNTKITPPAAEQDGALEKKDLPKVINLPKPDKIATPAAVKKPAAEATSSAKP